MTFTSKIFTLTLACSTCANAAPWVIDSQEEWEKETSEITHLTLKEGMAVPTGKSATLRSKLKTFATKTSAESLTINQSPIWENWEPTPNLGPANLQDAPVFLSIGPDNYWMFGRYGETINEGRKRKKGQKKKKKEKQAEFTAEDATLEGFDIPLKTSRFPNQFDAPGGLEPKLGGYHAWQSKDMVNWVHHGAITEKFSRWMTTAEYVDGQFYFYYDYPNDQDPHLYIDKDPTDGKPGKDMGMAFKDPSHGSDCAIIRSLDGDFHIIYEDWSPINARTHAWDSPLAGRSTSKDGISNFVIQKPVIDHRTTPTGETATYKHPHWASHPDWDSNIGEYNVHKPEQDAYGDWASISIGGQYYLFSDYDPAGGHQMSVGRFTSSSLDKEFTWCGNLGKGHPDPDICFAEGQFYLATQQNSDFTSPGPWVETVEVRVGVDTDNDTKIDQWSAWQKVTETYDHTPGFAKQIKKTPAAMDLSKLPAGFGFQFEIKMTDTTENESKPILDQITLTFADE